MHPFEIQYTEYNDKGALTNIKHYAHPTTIAEMRQQYEELNRITRTVVNPDDTVTTFKAYKVEIHVAVYKTIDNVNDLFAMFAM